MVPNHGNSLDTGSTMYWEMVCTCARLHLALGVRKDGTSCVRLMKAREISVFNASIDWYYLYGVLG